jgi:hypothetical protein
MIFIFCPRCGGKKWSCFQTGNTQNQVFDYTKFCDECHHFSFCYNCTPNGDNAKLDSYMITTNKYVVEINLTDNITEVSSLGLANSIMKIDTVIKIDPDQSSDVIDSKIKKLLVFL